ncbi:MAG: type II toxin-antitoxin system HipA family toxin [Gammaproteobacteria bacterium]|nr:MAG: type II toxin-antitoxin system HipA family toxin [Gammaproteobacteria bacterium]
MEQRCLYCYKPLEKGTADFHVKCSRNFFGTPTPPELEYSNEQMQDLASQIIVRSIAVTGVQPKLSLTIEKQHNDPKRSRFTIVGLWGDYILKPPSDTFPHLPENEDLTMHLSELFGISTAKHSLIRLQSGELAYITKRFDRENGIKLPQEDMCQLTETLTADKYRSSMEKIGKQVALHSTQPGFDAIRLFELILFSFLTGNADMHLKNFSLLNTQQNVITLSPTYDLLCTKLAMPDDKEEMALTLNGRKRKLKKEDFNLFAKSLTLPSKTVENIYTRFSKKLSQANLLIQSSFLPDDMKQTYQSIMIERAAHLMLTI